MTLNDHWEMHAVFTQFETERVDIRYTVGGAGNTVSRGELIIYTWNREQVPEGLFLKSVRTDCPGGSLRIVADGAMMQECDGSP